MYFTNCCDNSLSCRYSFGVFFRREVRGHDQISSQPRERQLLVGVVELLSQVLVGHVIAGVENLLAKLRHTPHSLGNRIGEESIQ